MFYFESDKQEMQNLINELNSKSELKIDEIRQNVKTLNSSIQTIKESVAELTNIQNEVEKLKANSDYSVKMKAEIEKLNRQLSELTSQTNANEELKREVETLNQQFETFKSQSDSNLELKSQVEVLNQQFTAFKTQPNSSEELKDQFEALNRQFENFKSQPNSSEEVNSQIEQIKQDIATLKTQLNPIEEIKTSMTGLQQNIKVLIEQHNQNVGVINHLAALFNEQRNVINGLEERIKKFEGSSNAVDNNNVSHIETETNTKTDTETETETETNTDTHSNIVTNDNDEKVDSPEKIFYLPEQKETYLPNDKTEALPKLKNIMNVQDILKFLRGNNKEINRKFQKLINNHANSAKTFINKLKINNFDDKNLSESITPKYFNLFKQVIFDNVMIAISRGIKEDKNKEFYTEFLRIVNAYLAQCGIYTQNLKSGSKISDEDLENMTVQTMKTDDAEKTNLIMEIERLPYRINYINELNEQKYLQHNGLMKIFKN